MQAQLSKGLLSATPLIRYVCCCTLSHLLTSFSTTLTQIEAATAQIHSAFPVTPPPSCCT